MSITMAELPYQTKPHQIGDGLGRHYREMKYGQSKRPMRKKHEDKRKKRQSQSRHQFRIEQILQVYQRPICLLPQAEKMERMAGVQHQRLSQVPNQNQVFHPA
jgi:hypothetical protein